MRLRRRELITGSAALALFKSLPADAAIWFPQFTKSNAFFDATAGSFPSPWSVISPGAMYVAATNTTWFAFDTTYAPTNTSRSPMVCTYNHSTGEWLGPFVAGMASALANTDAHGAPTLGRDNAGYIYLFYGSHATQLQLSTTMNPDDPSEWKAQATANLPNTCTFAKPCFIGSNLYLVFKTTGAGTGVESLTRIIKYSVAAGTLTTVSTFNVTDLNVSISVWDLPGNVLVNGTDIHMLGAWFQWSPNPINQDVFYTIFDTTTGNIRNFDSSVTIAPGSQPALLPTMQASFRVVNQTDNNRFGGNGGALAIDDAGNSNILYTDASAPIQAGANILHIIAAQGGVWSAPLTVKTFGAAYDVTNFTTMALTKKSGGGVDAWFADGVSAINPGTSAGLTSAGNMQKSSFNGTSWSTPIQVMAKGAKPLDVPVAVQDGIASCRVMFQEIGNGATPYATSVASLKKWAISESGGPIARVTSQFRSESLVLFKSFSSQPSAAFAAAIDSFIGTLIDNGIWFRTAALYEMEANDSQSAGLNWANPANFGLTVGGGAPSFTRLVGYSHNGTSDYLTSGLGLSLGGTYKGSLTAHTLAGYFPSLPGTTNGFGVWDGTNGSFIQATSTTMTSRLGMNAVHNDTVGNGIGFYAATKLSGTTLETQYETTQIGPTTVVNGGLSNTAKLIVGGISPASLNQGQTGMVYMGFLTVANMLVLRNARATYRAAIAGL